MYARALCFGVVKKLCQAEIKNLDLTSRSYHDVSRLDVSMDYAATVCGSECVGYL